MIDSTRVLSIVIGVFIARGLWDFITWRKSKHGLKAETAHLNIRKAIQFDLDEAEEELADCENEANKAFQQGRIFAHKYDLLVIDRILKTLKESEK